MSRRVLVTGGAGFVGSNVALDLESKGFNVSIIDGFLEGSGSNSFNLENFKGEVLKADIRDPKKYASFLKNNDVVIHLAGHVSHVDSMIDPENDLNHNALGTLRLLYAMKENCPKGLFVYGGTRGQYGKVLDPPATKDTALNPTDIYGVNKAAGEQYALVLSRTNNLNACSVRFTNAYGPRHQMKHSKWGILNWFFRLAMDGKDLTIYGEGKQLREYAWIGDIANAFSKICSIGPEKVNGKILNLGAPERISFAAMAEKIVKIVGLSKVVNVEWPEDRKSIEVGDFISDDSESKKLLDWNPSVDINKGLELTFDFYKKNKDRYW